MAQITLNSTGVASNGALALQSNGTTTAVTIDASQNVGIGYTSMNTTIAVNGNALFGTGAWPTTDFGRSGSRFVNASSTEDGILASVNMQSGVGASRGGYLYLGARGSTGVDGATFAAIGGIRENATSGSYSSALTFRTSTNAGDLTERARIDSSGNLALGNTTSLSATSGRVDLTINGTSSSMVSFGTGGARKGYVIHDSTDLTIANESTGAMRFLNTTERARITSGGELLVGLTSQTSTAAVLAVASTKNNGNAARIGLMSIGGISGGAGYPQIGYNTAFTSTGTINYIDTDTASWIRFNSGKVETFTAASGTSGNAISATTGPYVAQGGTSWTNSSDERLKDIIEPITDATNKVGQLRAVIGKFKTDPKDKRRSFLIAQDVQAVLPEAVDVSDPESLGVQYTDVIPLLVAAIKEQQALITTLTDRITALEAK